MRHAAIIIAAMLASGPAWANEYQHWKEPPPAPISPTGTVLSVENYRCEVTSPRSFECLNVGRVCIEQRKRHDEESAKTFGCLIEGSANYPCPKFDYSRKSDAEYHMIAACWPTIFGSF